LLVPPLDNDAPPFTAYAQKLAGTGFVSQYDGCYRPIITAQVSDFYSMVATSHYHATGHGTLFAGCYCVLIPLVRLNIPVTRTM
jgi:hypothetical protein